MATTCCQSNKTRQFTINYLPPPHIFIMLIHQIFWSPITYQFPTKKKAQAISAFMSYQGCSGLKKKHLRIQNLYNTTYPQVSVRKMRWLLGHTIEWNQTMWRVKQTHVAGNISHHWNLGWWWGSVSHDLVVLPTNHDLFARTNPGFVRQLTRQWERTGFQQR